MPEGGFRKPLPGYLFILTWPVSRPGGVNEVVLAVAERLPPRGIHPLIAVAGWSANPQPPSFRHVDLLPMRLREPWAAGAGWNLLPGFLRTLTPDIRAIRALVRRHKLAVINPHFPGLECCTFALMKATGLLRARFVLSFHGDDIMKIHETTGGVRALWRFCLNRADAVTACSESLRIEVARFAPHANVLAIHNGVDAQMFNRPTAPTPDDHILLHVGKFEHKKAQDVLLRSVHRLVAQGKSLKLFLVGANGPELDTIRSLIASLQMADFVELHVDVEHTRIPAFMQRATTFVLPSRAEPFGLVLLEAGAAGLPVIATAVGGITELIEHEETGLLISPDDEEGLAAAIDLLLSDRALASRLAAAWHAQVLARWSWEGTVAGYVSAADLDIQR